MAGGGKDGGSAFASTLTDLMTSLAVIFILLLVVFLKQSHDQSKRAKDEVREQLEVLLEEKSLALKQDERDPLTLAVMVGEKDLNFPVGEHRLSSSGATFVDGFFKNFAQKICDPELRKKIDSVIIEGHTDRSGERSPDGVRRNIELSQRRSFSVLEQAMRSVQGDTDTYECLLRLASASGRGSRSPMYVKDDYSEDLSRRVEIKIRVRSAEQQFQEIIDSTAKVVVPEVTAKPLVPPPPAPIAPPAEARPQIPEGLAPAPAAPAAPAPLR